LLGDIGGPLGITGVGDTGMGDVEGGMHIASALTAIPTLAGIGRGMVETARGIKQFFVSKEEAQQLAQMSADEQASINKYLQKNPQEAPYYTSGRMLETGGEIAGSLAVPGAKAVGLAGRGALPTLGRIGYGAAVGGGLAGAKVTQPGQSKSDQVLGGALFGAGVAGVAEALSYLTRGVSSLFATKADAAASGGLLKENPAFERGRALEQATGVKLVPGQLTGSPALTEMRPPQGVAEQQAKGVLRYFVNLRDRLTRTPQTSTQLAQKFNETTDDIYKQLVEVRKRVGDYQYARFRGSVDSIYAGKLFRAMDDIAQSAVPGTDAGQIIAMRNKLGQELTATKGYLTPEQILGWKERIDGLLAGKSDIFKNLDKANQRRLGAKLSDAMFASLEDTADRLQLSGQASPALRLRHAVEMYKRFSQPIKDLENSALGAIFRANKLTPEMAGKRLMALKPTEVRAIYDVLDRYNPDLIRQYQATKLYDAMSSGVALTPESAGRLASQTKFNAVATLKELTKSDGLRAVFDKNPQLLRDVQRGVSLLDRVADRTLTGVGGTQGLQSRSAELARNAVSGNHIFLAGTAAKMLGPAGLWKLTTTKAGLSTLRTLATAPLNSAKFTAATEALLSNLDDVPGGQQGSAPSAPETAGAMP